MNLALPQSAIRNLKFMVLRFLPGCLACMGLLLALILAGEAQADFVTSSQSILPSLSLPVGSRGVGMGEAFTFLADDVSALAWSPAGLILLQEPEAAFMHNEWNSRLGLRQEYAVYGQRFVPGGFAGSINYFSL